MNHEDGDNELWQELKRIARYETRDMVPIDDDPTQYRPRFDCNIPFDPFDHFFID